MTNLFSLRSTGIFVIMVLSFVSGVLGNNVAKVDFDPFGTEETTVSSPSENETDTSPVIPQLRMNNNEISDAFQIISDATGWSIFPTEQVSKARVSLWAEDITAKQLLDTIVTLTGFIYYREGDIISVMTYDEYGQHYGLEKQVVPLMYANAETIVNVIKPFLTKLGKTVVYRETNKIVLFESSANLQTIVGIIKQLDKPVEAETIIEVFDLQYMDAEVLTQTLREIFPSGEPGYNTETVGEEKRISSRPGERLTEPEIIEADALLTPQSQVGIYAISRTNQLIIKAQKSDIEELRKLIAKLDTFVEPVTKSYHFSYVDAADIFDGLEEILDIPTRARRFGGAAGQTSRASGRPGGITLVTKTNSILLTGPPSVHRIMDSIVKKIDLPGRYESSVIRVYKIENADVDEVAGAIRDLIESRQEQGEQTGELKYRQAPEGSQKEPASLEMEKTEEYVPRIEARVTVSKSTNSIIIRATARQQLELGKLIKELDSRRKQVLIKAVIVEVHTRDDMDIGVELDYFDGDFLAFTSYGLSAINPSTGVRDIIVSPGGTAAVIRPNKVQAILKALQGNDNVRIESAPQVLVNDNSVGTIQNIAEEPTRQTNQGETTTTTSFGEYVSAGTQFFVTPHISESDYLRVEYQIMLNSFGEQADPELPPARKTSTIQSEATVPDGSTIVVGGIQASNESKSVNKVPLLGDIPLIGLLFRSTIIRKQYITTYLFVTTTIIKSEDFSDLEGISDKAIKEVGEDGKSQTIHPQVEGDK
jgi:type II secretory pathway component GspD/PulD (secretin)